MQEGRSVGDIGDRISRNADAFNAALTHKAYEKAKADTKKMLEESTLNADPYPTSEDVQKEELQGFMDERANEARARGVQEYLDSTIGAWSADRVNSVVDDWTDSRAQNMRRNAERVSRAKAEGVIPEGGVAKLEVPAIDVQLPKSVTEANIVADRQRADIMAKGSTIKKVSFADLSGKSQKEASKIVKDYLAENPHMAANKEMLENYVAGNIYNDTFKWKLDNDEQFFADAFEAAHGIKYKDFLKERVNEIKGIIKDLRDEAGEVAYEESQNRALNDLLSDNRGELRIPALEGYMGEKLAEKPYDEMLDKLNNWERNNFASGVAAGFDLSDILSMGLADLLSTAEMGNVLEKANRGAKLYGNEERLYELAKLIQELESYRDKVYEPQGVMSKIGEGVGTTLEMLPEFALAMTGTGMIGSFAKLGGKAALKAALKAGGKELFKYGVKTTGKLGYNFGLAKVRGLAAAPFMPSTYNTYLDSLNSAYSFDDEGNLTYTPVDKKQAYFGSVFSTANEISSEYLGAGIGTVVGWGARGLGRMVAGTKLAEAAVGAGKKVRKHLPKFTPQAKVAMRTLGVQADPVSETLSEALGDIMTSYEQTWIGMDVDKSQYGTMDYWMTLAGVTLVYGGSMAALGAVNSYRDVKKAVKVREDILAQITDRNLHDTLVAISTSDDVVMASAALADMNWEAFGEEAHLARAYVAADLNVKILEGAVEEESRLDRFRGTIEGVRNIVYQGKAGEYSDIIREAEMDGKKVYIINGYEANTNQYIVVDATTGEKTSVDKSKVTPTRDVDVDTYIQEAYQNTFSLEAEKQRVADVKAKALQLDNPTEKDVARVASTLGIALPKVGNTVMLANGNMGAVMEVLSPTEYAVQDPSGATYKVHFTDILSTDKLTATAQGALARGEVAAPIAPVEETTQPTEVAETTTEVAETTAPDENGITIGAEVTVDGRVGKVRARTQDGKYAVAFEAENGNYEDTEMEFFTGEELASLMGIAPAPTAEAPEVAETAPTEMATTEDGSVDIEQMSAEDAAKALIQRAGTIEEAIAQVKQVIETVAEERKKAAKAEKKASLNDIGKKSAELQALDARLEFFGEVLGVLEGMLAEQQEQTMTEAQNIAEEAGVAPETTEATDTTTEENTPVERPTSGLVRNGAEMKFTDNVIKMVDFIAKRLGITVEFADGLKNEAGQPINGDITGKRVRISTSGTKGIKFIMGHEFFHRMKDLVDEQTYADFVNSIKEYAGEKEWNVEVARKRNVYRNYNAQVAKETMAKMTIDDVAKIAARLNINIEGLSLEDAKDAVIDGAVMGKEQGIAEVDAIFPTMLSYDDALMIEECAADVAGKLVTNTNTFAKYVEDNSSNIALVRGLRKAIRAMREFFDSFGYTDQQRKLQALDKMLASVLNEAAKREAKAEKKAIEGKTRNSIQEVEESAERLAEQGAVVNTESGDVRFALQDVLVGDAREQAIADLMRVTGRSRATVLKYLKAEESLAAIILDDDNQAFLDLQVDESVPSIWKNSDYPQGTVEFSNICRKRLPYTMIYQRLQKDFPNVVFDASALESIRQTMIANGEQVACALCFVEDRRQLMGEIGQSFIDALKGEEVELNDKQEAALERLRKSGDTYIPSLFEITTLDGMKFLRKKHPEVASAFVAYNNARGMQSAQLFQAYSAYHREILNFAEARVKKINKNGGLRIFSFSDFEAHHLIDLVQVLTDCAAKGVMVQGYTKVPEFANAVKDTKMKLNRSLIGKSKGVVDADYVPQEGEAVSPNVVDGKRLLFDTVEGIDVNSKDFFDSTDSHNVGNILVTYNEEQTRIAMQDPFVDYIIPFHTGIRADILEQKGIGDWVNYKNYQSERVEKDGKLKKVKKGINIYTDVLSKDINTERQFVNKYLAVCKAKGYVPKFDMFLDKTKKGEYTYTKGYYKSLLDFKMFDKNGKILPQEVVVPVFDNEVNKQILEDYVADEKAKAPNDELYGKVVDAMVEQGRLTEEQVAEAMGARYSIIGEVGAAALDMAEEATIRMDNLTIARQMEERGDSALDIRMATGWERGADGLWRYELMDAEVNLYDGNETAIRKKIEVAEEEEKDFMQQSKADTKELRERTNTYLAEMREKYGVAEGDETDAMTEEEIVHLQSLTGKEIAFEDYKERRRSELYNRRMALEAQLGYVKVKNTDTDAMIQTTRLGHIIQGKNADALFTAYPSLRDMEVQFVTDIRDGAFAAYATKGGYKRIELNAKKTPVDMLTYYLMHEVQHAIQDVEGFAGGGNLSSLQKDGEVTGEEAYDYYRKIAGEVEARNVSARLNMSAEERMNTLLSETEDVAREDQIFLRDGVEMAMAEGIKLPKEEYAKLSSTIMERQHTYGRPPFDYAFTDGSFYVYDYLGDGDSIINFAMPIVGNEDLIQNITNSIDNGTITDTRSLDLYAENLQGKQRVNYRRFADAFKKRHGNRGYGVTFRGDSASNGGSYLEDSERAGGDATPRGTSGNIDESANQELKTNFSLISPEMDADYLSAVERGDMETAQQMVMEAAKLAGYTEEVFHGTPAFGFTTFSSRRPSGAIFTTSNRSTAAEYGKTKYASVREINKPLRPVNTPEDVLYNARSIYGVEYRLATEEERKAIQEKVEKEARIVRDKLSEFMSEITEFPEELRDAVVKIENIIFDGAELRENGNDGDEALQILKDDYRWYREARADINLTDNRVKDRLTEEQKAYLNYLAGYQVGDMAIDIAHSYALTFSESPIATVDGGIVVSLEDLESRINEDAKIGSYHLYGNVGNNPLEIDGKGKDWVAIRYNDLQTTDDIAEWAKEEGYTSVKIKNITDGGPLSDVAIFFDSSYLKSADPVTYDDNGNVIPLSKRFNPKKEDIRYSIPSEEDARFERKVAFLEDLVRDYNIPLPTFIAQTKEEFKRMAMEYGIPEEEIDVDKDRGYYCSKDDIILINAGLQSSRGKLHGTMLHEYGHHINKLYLSNKIKELADRLNPEDIEVARKEIYGDGYADKDVSEIINELICFMVEHLQIEKTKPTFEGQIPTQEFIEAWEKDIESNARGNATESILYEILPLVKENLEYHKEQYGAEKENTIVIARKEYVQADGGGYKKSELQGYHEGRPIEAFSRDAAYYRRSEGADAQEVTRYSLPDPDPSDVFYDEIPIFDEQGNEVDITTLSSEEAKAILDGKVLQMLEAEYDYAVVSIRKEAEEARQAVKEVYRAEKEKRRKSAKAARTNAARIDEIFGDTPFESLPYEVQALILIATGQAKIYWIDKGNKRGLASELGLTGSTGDRHAYRNIWGGAKKSFNEVVHDWWESLGGQERGIDDQDLRNALISALQSVQSSRDAMQEIINKYDDLAEDRDNTLAEIDRNEEKELYEAKTAYEQHLANFELSEGEERTAYRDRAAQFFGNQSLSRVDDILEDLTNELERSKRKIERLKAEKKDVYTPLAESIQHAKDTVLRALERLRMFAGMEEVDLNDVARIINLVKASRSQRQIENLGAQATALVQRVSIKKAKTNLMRLLSLKLSNTDIIHKMLKESDTWTKEEREAILKHLWKVSRNGLRVSKAVHKDTKEIVDELKSLVDAFRKKELKGLDDAQKAKIIEAKLAEVEKELHPEVVYDREGNVQDNANLPTDFNAENKHLAKFFFKSYLEMLAKEVEYHNASAELREKIDNKEKTDGANAALVVARENYLNALNQFNSSLESLILEGKGKLRDWNAQKEQHEIEIRSMGIRAIGGKKASGQGERSSKMARARARINTTVNAPYWTFETVLEKIDHNSPYKKGKLYTYFMDKWADANDDLINRYAAHMEEIAEVMRKCFPDDAKNILKLKRNPYALYQYIMRKAESTPIGTLTYKEMGENGKMRDAQIVLNVANAMYVIAMWRQPRYQEAMQEKHGITQSDIDALMTNIASVNVGFLDFMDWVNEKFLPSTRLEYDVVYRKMNGGSMPKEINYFPARVAGHKEVDLANIDNGALPTTPSALKDRMSAHIMPQLGMDYFKVLESHIQDMDNWAAYAELTADLNVLLSSDEFRRRCNDYMGGLGGDGGGKGSLYDLFKQTSLIATGMYRGEAGLNQLLGQLQKAWATSNIAFRYWTAVKQISSITTGMFDNLRFYKHAGIAATGVGIYHEIKNAMEISPSLRYRWKSGAAGMEALARETQREDGYTVQRGAYEKGKDFIGDAIKTLVRAGMTPNAAVDLLACSIIVNSVYETEIARLTGGKREATEEEKRAAVRKAERAFNTTQQSSEGAYLAPVQANPAYGVLTTYMNASFALHRKRMGGIKELWKLMTSKQYRRYLKDEFGVDAAKISAKDAFKDILSGVVGELSFAMMGWGLMEIMALVNGWLNDDDDDEDVAAAKQEVFDKWWKPILPMLNGYLFGSAATSLASGFEVSLTPAYDEFVKDVKGVLDDSGNRTWEVAQMAAKYFVGVDLKAMQSIGAGLEAMFEDDERAGAVLKFLNAPNRYIKAFVGDRREGETLEEYQTRIIRFHSLLEDVVYEHYFDEEGNYIGEDAPSLSMSKNQAKALRKEYEAAYAKDVLYHHGGKEMLADYMKVDKQHKDICELLDWNPSAKVSDKKSELSDMHAELAYYQDDVAYWSKQRKNWVGSEEEYYDLLMDELQAKNELINQYYEYIKQTGLGAY